MSLWLSLGVPLTLGLALLALGVWIFRSRRSSSESVSEAGVIGETVRVEQIENEGRIGRLTVRGEIWSFESEVAVFPGDSVRITSMSGLKLKVEKVEVR